jgi:hypothetical protein
MSQTERKESLPSLDRLFSTPSLMNGEDELVYAELYARVEELAQPKDIWGHMMVSDVVNHFWEQQRYRRCTGAIINSGRRSALLKILRDGVGLNPADAMAVADLHFGVVRYEEDYSDSDPAEIPQTRKGVTTFLKKRGITEADIDCVAMESSVDTLTAIENLALKHELRREEILRELERRRARRRPEEPLAMPRQSNGERRALAKDRPDASAPPLIKDRSDTSAPPLIEPSA